MANIILWLVLASIWSSAFGVIKLGVATIDPMPLVAGRMLIGASILFLVLKLRGMSLARDRQAWTNYVVTGLAGNVIPFLLISYGEISVDSGLAAILIGMGPVVTVLLAHFFLTDEPLSIRGAAGIIIGVVGLIVLVGPDALSDLGGQLIGQLAILGAATSYAISTIYVKARATRPPLEMAAGAMLVGAFSITVATLLFGEVSGIDTPSTGSLVALVYLGIVPTALATLIYFFLVPRIGATRMSQVNFAVPIGGVLIGVFFLGEELAASTLIALPIIIVAVYLVSSGRKGRKVKVRQPPSEAGLPTR